MRGLTLILLRQGLSPRGRGDAEVSAGVFSHR